MDAIYVMYRGDTHWTLLYLGSDYRKVYRAEEWAKIHCQKMRRVRMLDSQACFMDDKIFRQKESSNALRFLNLSN